MRIAARWRITEADLWDCDALNLVAPAFIEFAKDGSGSFGGRGWAVLEKADSLRVRTGILAASRASFPPPRTQRPVMQFQVESLFVPESGG